MLPFSVGLILAIFRMAKLSAFQRFRGLWRFLQEGCKPGEIDHTNCNNTYGNASAEGVAVVIEAKHFA